MGNQERDSSSLSPARLSQSERDRLQQLEVIIDAGIKTFIEVGNALAEVRDRNYFRETHATFAEYCRDRWDLSRIHAYRLIQSAQVVANLSGVGPKPTSERQVRELARLSPEAQREAWEARAGKPTKPKPAPKPRPSRPEVRAIRQAAEDEEILAAGIEPEPADVAAMRRDGIIPEGVEVEVYDPFADDPDAAPWPDEDGPDMAGEQTDAEYLSHCPARAQLSDQCRAVFDRDALLYRALEPVRDRFAAVARPTLAKNRRTGQVGRHHDAVSWFLKAKHPKHWTACPDCKGTGRVEFIGKCPRCRTLGYQN